MWEYVIGGATIFGFIVTAGAWINGRLTRKAMAELIRSEGKITRDLIRSEGEITRELIKELSAQHRTMVEILKRMDAKLDILIERSK